jgi:DNA polymerase III delta prime subunit
VPSWEVPGNEGFARRLRQAADRGALAHALLLTGSGDRLAAARLAAAAFECTAASGRPCGVCGACRKVDKGIHPDVTEVRDDAHKSVAVDVVRAARTDAYVRPNEGARKVYIFPDCGLLTEQDQNVLLKIVEEGPPYAAFCFCAENPAAVLPTLRSRCVELPLRPTEADGGAEAGERARALCAALCAGKSGAAAEVLVSMERARAAREDVKALLEECGGVFAAALLARYGCKTGDAEKKLPVSVAKNLTKAQIVRTIELLQKYRLECRYNVSAGQVLGALAVELEGIL